MRRPARPAPPGPRCSRGLYVCGDHRDTSTVQGALYSGRRAAQAILADLGSDRTAHAEPRTGGREAA